MEMTVVKALVKYALEQFKQSVVPDELLSAYEQPVISMYFPSINKVTIILFFECLEGYRIVNCLYRYVPSTKHIRFRSVTVYDDAQCGPLGRTFGRKVNVLHTETFFRHGIFKAGFTSDILKDMDKKGLCSLVFPPGSDKEGTLKQLETFGVFLNL